MFLRPLGLLKVFVLVFRVGLFVCQTRNIKSLLLQILVQVSLNDFVDKFIKSLLAWNVECLGFEEHTLPQVVELARMVLDAR